MAAKDMSTPGEGAVSAAPARSAQSSPWSGADVELLAEMNRLYQPRPDLGMLLMQRLRVHDIAVEAAAALEAEGRTITAEAIAARVAAHPDGADLLDRDDQPDHLARGMAMRGWLKPGAAPGSYRLTEEGRRTASMPLLRER